MRTVDHTPVAKYVLHAHDLLFCCSRASYSFVCSFLFINVFIYSGPAISGNRFLEDHLILANV